MKILIDDLFAENIFQKKSAANKIINAHSKKFQSLHNFFYEGSKKKLFSCLFASTCEGRKAATKHRHCARFIDLLHQGRKLKVKLFLKAIKISGETKVRRGKIMKSLLGWSIIRSSCEKTSVVRTTFTESILLLFSA